MPGGSQQEWTRVHVQQEGTVECAPNCFLDELVRRKETDICVPGNIPEVSRSLKTRTQFNILLLNDAGEKVRSCSNNEWLHDVPAIASEKPVLDALSGAKYINQTARAVTSKVPARSTRIVTHLILDDENIDRIARIHSADVPVEVYVGNRDATIPVDSRVRFTLERVLHTVGTDRSYGMVV